MKRRYKEAVNYKLEGKKCAQENMSLRRKFAILHNVEIHVLYGFNLRNSSVRTKKL
jgi:hypothetical protein